MPPIASPAGGPSSTIRRDEILETASQLFASRGLRTSLQDIADACGIKPGSLYHHFDSKEAIVVELIRRYHGELDQIAEDAVAGCRARIAPAAADEHRRVDDVDRAVRCPAQRGSAVHVLRAACGCDR